MISADTYCIIQVIYVVCVWLLVLYTADCGRYKQRVLRSRYYLPSSKATLRWRRRCFT